MSDCPLPMCDELNKILNDALPQWAKLTGTEPRAAVDQPS